MEHFWLCCYGKSSGLYYYAKRMKCGIVCILDSHLCICTHKIVSTYTRNSKMFIMENRTREPFLQVSPFQVEGSELSGGTMGRNPLESSKETFSAWKGPGEQLLGIRAQPNRQARQRKEASLCLSSLCQVREAQPVYGEKTLRTHHYPLQGAGRIQKPIGHWPASSSEGTSAGCQRVLGTHLLSGSVSKNPSSKASQVGQERASVGRAS